MVDSLYSPVVVIPAVSCQKGLWNDTTTGLWDLQVLKSMPCALSSVHLFEDDPGSNET
jgi:hypothetical protein